MRPDFSEFSYGFAFTHEYVNRNPRLKAAPELPSLIKEAKRGYDLALGYQGHPKYFQFKLSTYLNRSNAIHWQDHRRAHYRVRLTTRPRGNHPTGTDQHSRLKRLAETVHDVFYVAPRFHSQDEFDSLFLRGLVTENSLWAPLKDLRWVSDNEVHYMTFTKDQEEPWWHSESVRLEGRFAAEEHYETIRETVTIDEDFFRDLRSKLRVALYEPQTRALEFGSVDYDDDIEDVLRDIDRLLTVQFGLRMVMLVEDGTSG